MYRINEIRDAKTPAGFYVWFGNIAYFNNKKIKLPDSENMLKLRIQLVDIDTNESKYVDVFEFRELCDVGLVEFSSVVGDVTLACISSQRACLLKPFVHYTDERLKDEQLDKFIDWVCKIRKTPVAPASFADAEKYGCTFNWAADLLVQGLYSNKYVTTVLTYGISDVKVTGDSYCPTDPASAPSNIIDYYLVNPHRVYIDNKSMIFVPSMFTKSRYDLSKSCTYNIDSKFLLEVL